MASQFTRLRLLNWRNFREVEVPLGRRVFLVGPNASGKSNFLDAIRFLRDVAEAQGGFQQAVLARGGVSQVRSLHARQYPSVRVEVDLETEGGVHWTYALTFHQDNQRRALVKYEAVTRNGETVLQRPDAKDAEDPNRLTQTHLEQVNSNLDFRPLGEVRYLHIVPQLMRDPGRASGRERDHFGADFLEQIARTPRRTLDSRLKRINEALRVAVPQLKNLELIRDDHGTPHLRGLYEHWRPGAGWQTEEQFSDGTLRLLGLLWVLLDGSAPLLLEEPELSLHSAVIQRIPAMMERLARKTGRQVIVSTHSADLLVDEGIDPSEVLMLIPSKEGTRVANAGDDQEIRELVRAGIGVAEAVLPRSAPRDAMQLALFGG
jgi:predicted ATPase